MFLVRFLKALFKGRPKSGYSIKGFWGQIKHFNKHGVQIGYTVKGFWGQRKRYDMNGNLKSVSWKNFWGGYNTYDADGNLIRRAYRNFWGGYNTYNRAGKKIQESYRNFWDGMNHYDIENSDSGETFIVEKRATSRVSVSKEPISGSGNITSSNNFGKNASATKSSTSKQGSSSTVQTVRPVTEEKVAASKSVESEPFTKETYLKTSASSQHTRTIKEDVHSVSDVRSGTDNRGSFETIGKRKFNKDTNYYSSINECVKAREIAQYVRLLVFKYRHFVEFPAIAYIDGDMVKVEPLQVGAIAFVVSISEIANAREEKISDLDMSVMDDEFLACITSGVGKEFEDLLPEYPFEGGSICRTQYELDCGMVVTEKSMEELRKLCEVCNR